MQQRDRKYEMLQATMKSYEELLFSMPVEMALKHFESVQPQMKKQVGDVRRRIGLLKEAAKRRPKYVDRDGDIQTTPGRTGG